MANPWDKDPVVAPSGGHVFTLPQSPAQAATTNHTVAETTGTNYKNAVAGATIPADITKANADAQKAALEAQQLQAKQQQEHQADRARTVASVMGADSVLRAINEARGEIGTFTTGFPGAIARHFPGTQAYGLGQDLNTIGGNIAFDQYKNLKENMPQGAQGGIRLTDNELGLLKGLQGSIDQGLPQSKLTAHLDAIEQQYRRNAAMASGLNPDDPNIAGILGIHPLDKNSLAANLLNGGNGNPPAGGSGGPNGPSGPNGGGTGPQQIAGGATRTVNDPKLSSILNTMYANGASLDQINGYLATVPGASKVSPTDYATMQEFTKRHPGYQPFNATRTENQTLLNRAAASAPGAAVAGLADAGSFGGLSALAPTQMANIEAASPVASTLGEIGGSMVGTNMLARLGRAGLQKLGGSVAERALANTGGMNFARNLLTDATYGGIYNGISSGDPVGGAVAGALGSTLGQGAGKVGGALVGGLKQNPAAQYLANQGISMTVGKRLGGLGGQIIGSAEDKMSLPGVQDLIANARQQSMRDVFDNVAGQAGAPIGFTPPSVGEVGPQGVVRSLTGEPGNSLNTGATGAAFDAATAGKVVPIDGQLSIDMQAARNAANKLPPDLRQKFLLAVQNRVLPLVADGQMTGENFQQSIRGLKGYKAEATKPGFEGDYRDALSQVQGALTDNMMRNGGADVVNGLNNANQAYRMSKVIQAASEAAKNGSGSGEVTLPTPAQLNTASYQAAAKYPGPRPFGDLLDAAQQVIPNKVPDSGTAGRLLLSTLLAGGGAYGGYGGYKNDGASGALSGGVEGAALTGIPLAALALGASRPGQIVLNKALFDRPQTLAAIGALIRKQAGLAGSASVPLALEYNQ